VQVELEPDQEHQQSEGDGRQAADEAAHVDHAQYGRAENDPQYEFDGHLGTPIPRNR